MSFLCTFIKFYYSITVYQYQNINFVHLIYVPPIICKEENYCIFIKIGNLVLKWLKKISKWFSNHKNKKKKKKKPENPQMDDKEIKYQAP